ncbi:N-acetyltransferase domain-containing protein [Frankia sp. AiPs1]|uniref:hypothetical protein n=1 Tax=Frankia sp. AiPa1 TaxID=573492 RepID=UPI00202B8AD8|nr:hypothetical protein [Frankia sp. AiPa1]MCL9760445.1 hypothetical protein [Frankia sp. AiPa1]
MSGLPTSPPVPPRTDGPAGGAPPSNGDGPAAGGGARSASDVRGPGGSADPELAAAAHTIVRFARDECPLSPAEDRWLRTGLASALPDLRMNALFDIRPGLLRESQHLVVGVERASGTPVSALGASWATTASGRPFLHIGIQFVAAELRGGQAFATSWLALLEEVAATGGFPYLAALRTYNPVAYCAMRAYGRLPGAAMYPAIGTASGDPDAQVVALAGEIAAALAPGAPFDPASGGIAGIGVPRDLYRVRPQGDDAEVNAHFERHAEPGDRILCMVRIPEETVDAIMANFTRRTRKPARSSAARG